MLQSEGGNELLVLPHTDELGSRVGGGQEAEKDAAVVPGGPAFSLVVVLAVTDETGDGLPVLVGQLLHQVHGGRLLLGGGLDGDSGVAGGVEVGGFRFVVAGLVPRSGDDTHGTAV